MISKPAHRRARACAFRTAVTVISVAALGADQNHLRLVYDSRVPGSAWHPPHVRDETAEAHFLFTHAIYGRRGRVSRYRVIA